MVKSPPHLKDFWKPVSSVVLSENKWLLNDIIWKSQIIATNREQKFRILYYGELFRDMIFDNETLPCLVIAEEINEKEKIILFDGSIHGYASQFIDVWDKRELKNRIPENIYYDINKNDIFEIIFCAYYNSAFDEEREYYVMEEDNNLTELINGRIITFEEAKLNGFDAVGILGIDPNGNILEIMSLELE